MILRQFPPSCPPGWTSSILNASARDVEYDEHPGPLSIKCVLRGEEMHEVPGGGRYAVTPDRYLLLNQGQRYGSWIHSRHAVEIMTVFFRPGLLEEVVGTLASGEAARLDEPEGPWQSAHFFEGLYPHDETVTPILTALHAAIASATADELSLEEQLRHLIERLVCRHLTLGDWIRGLPAARPATRRELYRRLARARDFLDSSLGEAVDLHSAARIACLSPHYFLRSFKAVFGLTPHQYLTRARIERAKDLLVASDLSVTEVCSAVGFESLGSFSSLFRRSVGCSPAQFRKRTFIERREPPP